MPGRKTFFPNLYYIIFNIKIGRYATKIYLKLLYDFMNKSLYNNDLIKVYTI